MKYLFLALILLSCNGSCLADTYYVKTTGNDTSNDGRSWGTAFATLQKAIEVSQYGDQIWVAEGIYKPTAYPVGAIPTTYAPPLTDRSKSFHLVNGVKLYGGFMGIEGAVIERTAGHKTILSGDIGIENNDIDNCYHVVISVKDDSTTVLDGFTITKGKANVNNSGITVEGKVIPSVWGGGMFNRSTSLKVTNCIFSANTSTTFGGGMENMEESSPILKDLLFTSNASNDGGGMHNYDSSPTLINVTFSNNTARWFGGGVTNRGNSFTRFESLILSNNKADYGGGMYNMFAASPILRNVIFLSNTAFSEGGGMYNYTNSIPILEYVIFQGNFAQFSGGGMYNTTSAPILRNVAFIKNLAQSASGGGGMANWEGAAPILANVIFWANKTMFSGAGLANFNASSPILTNVTFAENATTDSYIGLGGGMYNSNNCSPKIKNVIFWGNKVKGSATEAGADVFNVLSSSNSNTTKSILLANNTLMQLSNTSANYPPSLFPSIDSSSNIFAQDPLFVDAVNGNFRLQDCSPAINSGANIEVSDKDFDGNVRPYPYGVALADMGAYENQSIAGGGPASLNVTDSITNGTVLKVAGEITATNQVMGATALYQATKSITLLPDFSATGNTFTAVIGGCGTGISASADGASKR